MHSPLLNRVKICYKEALAAALVVPLTDLHSIDSEEQLAALYPAPRASSQEKVRQQLSDAMLEWLKHSPFFVLSSQAADGIDCSPRGDGAGTAFKVLDKQTIAIPDRKGNNRVETLHNVLRDSRVGLVFLIPGIEQALRIKGHAKISVDPGLLDSMALDGSRPKTVLLITIKCAFVQNARAVRSADLWNESKYTQADHLPDAATLTYAP